MNRIDELLLVAYAHKDESARVQAALKAIDECVLSGLYDTIAKMATDERLVPEVREKAGENLIRKYVKDGEYNALLKMLSDERFPESVKNMAERNVESAAVIGIKKLLSRQDYEAIFAMILDERLPKDIKDKAGKALEEQASVLAEKHKLSKTAEGPRLGDNGVMPPKKFLNKTPGAEKEKCLHNGRLKH